MEWTVYDSANTSGDIPSERMHAIVAYYNGLIYVYAGSDGDGIVDYNDLYSFNLMDKVWTDLTNPDHSFIGVSFSGGCADNGFLYVFFGWRNDLLNDSEYVFKVDLSDLDYKWEEIKVSGDANSLKGDSFAYTHKNNVFYIFGGLHIDNGLIRNDLMEFNLATNPLELEYSSNSDFPTIRTYHSLVTISGRLYLFGGDLSGQKLNDLWVYTPQSDEWKLLFPIGEGPSARSHHVATAEGDYMIIWGGIGNAGYFNDMYKYNAIYNQWERLESASDEIPSARYSPCIDFKSPYLYLYGGQTESGLQQDMWQYNTGDRLYTLITHGNRKGPGYLKAATCVLEKNEDDEFEFFVMYGTGVAEQALNELHSYNIAKMEWTLLFTSEFLRASPMVKKIGKKVIVGGGHNWGLYIFKELSYIDLDAKKEVFYNDFEYIINGGYAYLGSSLYIHSGSSNINAFYTPRISRNRFITVNLFDLHTENNPTWSCSPGTELVNGQCELCPKGKYSDQVGDTCDKCPPGTFFNGIGGSSSKQCYPCGEGTYNQYEGAHYCLDCPPLATCPGGSDKYTYETQIYKRESLQPPLYGDRQDDVKYYTLLTYLIFSIVLVLVIVIILTFKKIRRSIKEIDIYKNYHSHAENEPVIITKNLFGAVFTIAFVVVALVLVSTALIDYFLDNIQESKSLVPLMALEDEVGDFSSYMSFNVTLLNYLALCVTEPDAENNCDESISFSYKNIEIRSGEKITKKCYEVNQGCTVVLECSDCEILSSATILFQFTHAHSYSSGIISNITAFSSIHHSKSSTLQAVSSEENTLFKGYPASKFHYTLTPSLYKDTVTGKESNGYHISATKTATPGMSYNNYDLTFIEGLFVELDLLRNENCLVTIRAPKQSWILLLSALIGSVFGIMGFTGWAMEELEGKIHGRRMKKDKKNEEQQFAIKKESLKIFLGIDN